MKVIKRNGQTDKMDVAKIRKQTFPACDGFNNISPEELEFELNMIMKNGITTKEIQKALIDIAMGKASIDQPQWIFVAARLAMYDLYHQIKHKHGKAVSGNVYELVPLESYLDFVFNLGITKYSAKDYKDMGFDFDRLQEEVLKHHSNDMNFTIYGLNLLLGRYLLKDSNNTPVELPQHMFMHIAMMIASAEQNNKTDWAIRFYESFTNLYFMVATPTLSNLRKKFSNCFSCYVGVSEDSLEGLMDAYKEQSIISKWGGGLGWDYSLIRALAGPIQGIKGLAKGKIPWLKIENDLMIAVDQLGQRPGSLNAYIAVWDKDVFDFLDVKKSGGEERRTCEDLFISLIADDVFMDRVYKDADWYLFDPYDVPELNQTWGDEFRAHYWKYVELAETNPESFLNKPIKIKARDIMRTAVKYMNDIGMPFWYFKDNVNRVHKNPEEGIIRTSNLCVAPETKILTKDGYKVIEDVAGTKQEVWNGQEWSEIEVFKTNDNAHLLKVKTTSGIIECTDYHKFYIQTGYGKNSIKEVRAADLKVGDKLIKFDLPTIDGHKELELAYENGFYSGDGCEYYNNRKMIYLYKYKQSLLPYFNNYYKITNDNDRVILWYKKEDLKQKFFVPDSTYTIESRVKWLAGLLDSDGTLTKNVETQSFQIGSINYDFLYEVLLMLQTLGVTAKLVKAVDAGYRRMPKNDGTGEYGDFYCKTSYRLLIAESGVQRLLNLGLKTYRLQPKLRKPNRNAEQFIKVVAIIDENRYDSTYCFTEPKRHMGMFNGILTGQCMEIAQPTTPEETAICNLASLNLAKVNTPEKIKEVVPIAIRMLDNVNDVTDYLMDKHKNHQLRTRAIGLGVMGEAELVATKQIMYGSDEHKMLVNELYKDIYTTAEKTSMELGKEKGEWKKGKGTRNAYIGAIAPTSSISHICGTTPSHEPVFKRFWKEDGIFGVIPVVAPNLSADTYMYYVNAYEINQKDMLRLTAIKQKYVDQSISHNLYYIPEEITARTIFEDIMFAWKSGVKTLYYTRTKSKEVEKESDKIHCHGCE